MKLPTNLKVLEKYSNEATKDYTRQNRRIEYKRDLETGVFSQQLRHGPNSVVSSTEHLPSRQIMTSSDTQHLEDFLKTTMPGQKNFSSRRNPRINLEETFD